MNSSIYLIPENKYNFATIFWINMQYLKGKSSREAEKIQKIITPPPPPPRPPLNWRDNLRKENWQKVIVYKWVN